MAVIEEKFNSRAATESESATAELAYVVHGTDDDTVVRNLVASTAPATYLGLVINDYTIEPLGGGVWDCKAHYIAFESTGEFSFETGGGTQHITHSRATVQKKGAGASTAPDFQGAIGVTQDRVEGTDITVPVFNFAETHRIADAVVAAGYKATVFGLTGKVNNAPFKGWAAGEVLFLGASGSKRGFDDWEITYRFACSPNATGLTIGNITGVNKEGWQYLWVLFESEEDATAKRIVKRPKAAYVEQVYEYGDFSLLGIGV